MTADLRRRRTSQQLACAAAAFAMLPAFAARAATVAGVALSDSLRLTPDGPLLLLNGAGERRMLLFHIYAIGLYLPQRARTMEEALAQQGQKRMLMVMLRDGITALQVHDHVLARMADGTQPEEMAVMQPHIDELDRIIQGEKIINRGGTISLDYFPGQGTIVRVNGLLRGKPMQGENFYNALLRIWLGPGARSAPLRDALLGNG
ncbi:MAG: chalcone isomerase family protein [Betaproteobacteria bacterium]